MCIHHLVKLKFKFYQLSYYHLQLDSQREIQLLGYLRLMNEDLPLALFISVTADISRGKIQTNLK